MTREEAKTVFLNRGFIEVEGEIIYDANKWRESCRVISEWLEQEPCDDTISRQAALKELKESAEYHANDSREEALLRRDRDIIRALPSVIMRDATPEEQKSVDDYIKSISKPTGINFWDLDDNDDCISRKAVLSLLADHFDNVFDMVKELPSVAIPPEHDGCKDCKYETYPEYYYPCCECKQNYVDKWQKKPHWIHRNDDYTDWLECSNCGYGSEGEVKYGEGTPFCPHCGERLENEN